MRFYTAWAATGREKAAAGGIRTARDLLLADAVSIRAQFGVVVERTVSELRGIGCQPLEAIAPDKKQILSSCSFGRETARRPGVNVPVPIHQLPG